MNQAVTPAVTDETLVPSTMKAAMFYAPLDVRYEETPVPMLGPGELLVKVGAALTCGTDLKCYRRGHPVLLKNFPSPFGHECAGTVAAIGEGIEDFSVGDRVVVANSAPCYQCHYCNEGKHNLCDKLDLLNGAYADYLTVPARITAHNTHKLPDSLPFEIAAFTEPLAVSLRGVALSNIQPGHRVAVMGLGPIGLLLIKAAKLKGAHITALGRNPLKRELAQTFGGADVVLDITDGLDAAAIKQNHTLGGIGFDVVVEAIGQPEMWENAVAMVQKGGTVNLFGGCASGTTVTFDTRRLHYDEITLISLFHHTPSFFAQALALLASGEIDPTPLLTTRMPMAQVPEALTLMGSGQAIKVLLTP